MSMLDELVTWVTRPGAPDGRDDDYYECRRCGSTLSHRGDSCPHCGSDETVVFDL